MIHIALVRALFPDAHHERALFSLLESAGINVQEADVTAFANHYQPARENTTAINRLARLKARNQDAKFLVVAFATGKPELHLHGFFQTLSAYDFSMLPPVGVIFEPDWPAFVRDHGKWPRPRHVRIPFRSFGSNNLQTIHVIPLLSLYCPEDGETLAKHLGFMDKLSGDREDETEPFKKL